MSETNERILRDCYQLYVGKSGLSAIGVEFNLDILPPTKQVVVLLLGNHSAGKSSFINWYVGDGIQKAGVAVETQGFTFVRYGRRRETLLAEATLMCMPQFQELETIEGLAGFLTTELSPSQQRKFQFVTFIDSPGLVDGGIEYPFDVEKTLLTLGKSVDLIFVFFDPVGQALCRRTLAVVHQLMAIRREGLVFLLSKVDEAGHQGDRQKVVVQIVQELANCAGFNRQGFEIKSIHIPGLENGKNCFNQIEEVSDEIDKAVGFTVQRALNRLKNDCNLLEKNIQRKCEEKKFKFTLPALVFFAVSLSTAIFMLLEPQSNKKFPEFLTFSISFMLFGYFSKLQNILNVQQQLKIRKMKNLIKKSKKTHSTLYTEYFENI